MFIPTQPTEQDQEYARVKEDYLKTVVKPPKVFKKDRGFAPDHLKGLRVSDYHTISVLNNHYRLVETDVHYKRQFEKAFNAYAISNHSEEPYIPQAHVYRIGASSISACERQLSFKLLGVKKELPGGYKPQWHNTALVGTSLHEYMLFSLMYTRTIAHFELDVWNKAGSIGGRVDGIVRNHPQGLPDAVLDIKTVKQADFVDGPWSTKMPKYIDQISIYAYLLDIPVGLVLLVSRDTGMMNEYAFDVDRDYVENTLLAKHTKLIELAKQTKVGVPEELWQGNHFACSSFCQYYKACAALEAGEPVLAYGGIPVSR